MSSPSTTFLHRVLEPPPYGWSRNGELYKPTTREIMSHWLSRMNLFATRKNWFTFTGWFWTLALLPFFVVFVLYYWSFAYFALGFAYAMVWMGTMNIVWLHRYGSHRAFTFTHPIFRFVVRNLPLRLVPEEAYVVSHVVHHALSEEPGDPYNAHAGRLYCFLAGELHQPIAKDMSREDYARAVAMVEHTGLKPNTYEQYQTWGTITHPLRLYVHHTLNWLFWYGVFYAMGGHQLACALFGVSFLWAVGIRDFNFAAHGGGKDKRRDGVDFNRRDLSINQLFPGYVSGEWHNNHHLFPRGIRSGFLWWQLDTAYGVILLLKLMGGVTKLHDYKQRFLDDYYEPYRRSKQAASSVSG